MRLQLRIFLLTAMFCVAVLSPAQITGRVTDSLNIPLPYCNVNLMKAADSSLVTGVISDTAGVFRIENTLPGTFVLLFSNLGYQKKYSAPIYLPTGIEAFKAGTVRLKTNSKLLKGVEVNELKSFIEHKIDRTVYNIESSTLAAGNNALEILKQLPGVVVNNNDAISVRGKPGVLLMIDGRTSYLSAADAANYLRTLDASQIEKIEIITNPSARFDASGNAVINVILKKDKNLGLNAQLFANYAQGFYGGGWQGFNANYRRRKFNFFGSYSKGFYNNYSISDQQNIFSSNGEPVSIISGHSNTDTYFSNNSGRLGFDYMPDAKQTFGMVAEGYYGIGTFLLHDRTLLSKPSGQIDSSLLTEGPRSVIEKNLNCDLNYRIKIDSLGRELSANIDYAAFSISSDELDETVYNFFDPAITRLPAFLKYKLPTNVSIAAAKIDYVHPLGKETKLEGGLKSSFVQTDNNGRYWNVVNGIETTDTLKSNHFRYTENLNSAYLIITRKISKKLDGQIGLRAEDTHSQGIQTVGNSSFARDYLNLFPSGFLNWKIDTFNSLNFSYSRRIDRPDYGQLNPFRFYHNPLNYSQGNPFLLPQLSDNLQADYIFRNFLTISTGYLHMTDVISDASHQDESNHITYTVIQNLNAYNSYNILVSLTLHPKPWWTMIGSANEFHDHYYGLSQEGYYSKSGFTGIFNLLNSFTFKKGWSAEMGFFYRTININGLVVNDPIYHLDIGIRKLFATGRGAVALKVLDALWSDRNTNSEVFGPLNYRGSFYSDSRRIRLSVSWKFGRSQFQREEKRKSADEEMNRVKK
jgi:hypothetical protein